jgi:DNA polymerase alpha-associated DNA helicase A
VCWIPILKGKKLILAGDPMQLPPTVLSVDKKNKKSAGLGTQSKTPAVKPSQKDKKAEPTPVPEENSPVDVDSSDSEGSSSSEGETEPSIDKQKPPRKDVSQKKDKPARPKNHAPVLRPPRTLETTLFDRLEKMYGSAIKRMLQVQYRLVFHNEHPHNTYTYSCPECIPIYVPSRPKPCTRRSSRPPLPSHLIFSGTYLGRTPILWMRRRKY